MQPNLRKILRALGLELRLCFAKTKSAAKRCFRNLLLVTGPQLLFAKALALDLSYVEVTEAKFGCNLLLPKPLY